VRELVLEDEREDGPRREAELVLAAAAGDRENGGERSDSQARPDTSLALTRGAAT